MKTIYSIICALCVICGLSACSKDHTGSIDVSGSCLVEKFVLNGQYEGIINTEKRLVKLTLTRKEIWKLPVLQFLQVLSQV